MSSEKVFYSSDLQNPSQTGLFDRIINIKFTRKNGETFTLRTDYEPIWRDGKIYFKVCQPKPEIRVQYTQYQGTLINIDIFITNFNIIEKSGARDHEVLNANAAKFTDSKKTTGAMTNQQNDTLTMLGNHITKAEIQMGYRGQFHDWGAQDYSDDIAQDVYEAFQNLEVFVPKGKQASVTLAENQLLFAQHRKCFVEIQWAANITNPPDRVTQLHGYVGTTEPGFQPLSQLSLDCASESGTTAKITKKDIYKGLDDEYYTTDEVSNKDHTDALTLFSDSTNSKVAFRNLFNGGFGFTLLEAYCFHAVTRRFVKSNITVKRNKNLEQAALEFARASVQGPLQASADSLEYSIRQSIYRREQAYEPTYFKEVHTSKGEHWEIVEAKMSSSYKEYLEKIVTDLMIENYIGPRFTIKRLPEQRALYLAIRETLITAAKKKVFMTWWQAAKFVESQKVISKDSINTSSQQKKNPGREEVSVEDRIEDLRKYVFDLEAGETSFDDYYLDNMSLSKDWIIPVQNISSSVDLKDQRGGKVTFRPPIDVNDSGFVIPKEGKGKAKEVKCFSGLFEVRDAYMFGVPVLCTKRASQKFKSETDKKDSVDILFYSDAQGQIDWICTQFHLKYHRLHHGGYLLYVQGETARDIAGHDFIAEQYNNAFKLPAIYDMTLTPIRKIRCPFYAFLDPMTVINWNSTTAIGTMISYYYQPQKGDQFFMLIKSNIDFSTVGDFNTMEMELVDVQRKDTSLIPDKLNPQEFGKAGE